LKELSGHAAGSGKKGMNYWNWPWNFGARVHFVECTALIRQRLEQRRQDKRAVSDGRWEIFRVQRADFDPKGILIKQHGLHVRFDRPAEVLVKSILKKIR
jgi:hypothetical protein